MSKPPLSQASGKKKLLVAGPSAVLCALLLGTPQFDAGARMLAAGLAAYAIVGLLEVLLGQRLVRAGERWANLPGWQKFVASTVVIIVALGLAISAIPLLASL